MFLRGSRTSQNHSPRWSQIGACRRRRRRFAPGLLPLEPRALLSTLTVTNDADSGKGSLRYELGKAQAGDTIVFSPKAYGTITLTSGPLEVATSVSIQGPGASKLTVSGDDSSTVFDVNSGATSSISEMTITDGLGAIFGQASGGGIFNQGTLTLNDAVITGNTNTTSFYYSGYSGGGGILNQGTMKIAGSTIYGNTGIDGGGIDNSGTLTISDSTVSGNSCRSGGGGGIFNQGTLTLNDAVVTGNTSPTRNVFEYLFSGGGGVFNGGTLTIAGGSVTDNSGGGAGGIESNGSLTIKDATISGNTAPGFFGVGGILSGNSGPASSLTVIDSTISGNTGTDVGGIDGYNMDLVGSVVSGNNAGGFYTRISFQDGGGILCSGTSTITGSQISNNTNQQSRYVFDHAYGGGITDFGSLTVTGSTISGNAVESDTGFSSGGGLSLYAPFSTTPVQLTIEGCTFRDNQAVGNFAQGNEALGGAISVHDEDATVTISGSSFAGNAASSTGAASGGALDLFTASASVVGCTFTGNQAVAISGGNNAAYEKTGYGGAISNGSPLTISGSTFIGNTVQTNGSGNFCGGGAINNEGTDATLNLSSDFFDDNGAIGGSGGPLKSGYDFGPGGTPAGGGGLWLGYGAAATVTGSTFIGNSAAGGSTGPATGDVGYQGGYAEGGAIGSTGDSSLTVKGCIIAGNSATGGAAAIGRNNVVAGPAQGGGIFDRGGTLQVTNSTITGNSAVAGANGYSFDNGGGGVFISGTSARASFTDDLIALNATTVAPGDGSAYGGGIYIGTGAVTTLTHTKVIDNKATSGGDNIYGTYTDG